MSTKKGNGARTRPQRHQNRTSFKNDLYDTSNKIKMINNIKIAEVCERCRKIIDWKRQYRKYKPLTQPKSCNLCLQKTVKQAYHVICTPCAVKARQCAKCLVSADEAEIIPPNKTEEEEMKERVEFDKLLKTLPERKRRTFLRYLKKKDAKKEDQEGEDEEGVPRKEKKVQNTELDEEIRKKFEQLKMIHRDMKEELGFLHDLEGSDDEDDVDDYSSGDSFESEDES